MFKISPLRVALGLLALGLLAGVALPELAFAAQAPQPLAWLEQAVQERGLLLSLGAVFLGGLALNLTPCVYPLIPVTLAFFGGQAKSSTSRTLQLACAYVLGLSLSYAALGVLAAQTGSLLGAWLQKPAVLLGIVLLIVALALSMFGVYELRPPHALVRRFGEAKAGIPGAVVMGMVVGLIAAPCIGPFLLGLFLFVSRLANVAHGFLLFFVLGLGMGVPYIFLALAVNRTTQLPKGGAWLVWIKKALGFVLLGLALYLLMPLLSDGVMRLLIVGLLVVAGAYLGWLERSRSPHRWFPWIRWVVGGALVLSALGLMWPKHDAVASVTWAPYTTVAFQEARERGQPIVIDVYADWCLPCVEMDHVTFRHPDVVRALQQVATLRVDATQELSAEAEQLIDQFQVIGVPTVLLIDGDGREHVELRLLGFITPAAFLERLQHIARRAP